MCCLFGMIDHQQRFSAKEKSRLLSVLAAACEVRGTDASGVAYNAGGRLRIYKRPVAAHKLDLRIPYDAKVIMGHTRMTTQGAAKRNCNNHPFRGNLPKKEFALAHNGILYNDHTLRRQHALPKTKIETDSYIAVQLIEQKKALDTESLRFMAEQVQGSFTFTILDEKDRLYIIKGSNPLCLYHFPEQGVWFYASTKEILDKGLAAAGFLHHPHERITMDDGEILCIAPDGKINRNTFQMQPELYGWYYAPFHHTPAVAPRRHSDYREQLLDFGQQMGISYQELSWLELMDVDDDELEMALFDDEFRREILLSGGFYEDLEEDDFHACSVYSMW